MNNIENKTSNGEKPLVSNVQQQQTPDLKFKDENGKTISLSSLKGKVVFINLWATWCPPCIHEMPSINELRKTFKDNDDLVFLMVDVDGKIDKASKWMKNKKFDLPVHVPDSEIPRELFTGSIPTTIIVDKKNNIVGRQVGAADYMSAEVIELMKNLLNEK
jgi:thiol-disulfide isomerase/thioredoxin